MDDLDELYARVKEGAANYIPSEDDWEEEE